MRQTGVVRASLEEGVVEDDRGRGVAAGGDHRDPGVAGASSSPVGITGAQVDRIASSSGVDKARMYGWFGSRNGLFDEVFDDQPHRIVESVSFDAADLPGYAIGLYDSYLAAPELIHLTSWNRLERVLVGDLLTGHQELARPKYDAIARAPEQGRVLGCMRPDEVYALVIALAGTWSPVGDRFSASTSDHEVDHDRRRAALRLVLQRALRPG